MNYLIHLIVGYGVALVSLVVFIVLQEIAHRREIKRLVEDRDDVMNRFMARDFQQYVGGRHVLAPASDVELAEEALDASEFEKQMADGLRVD